MKEFVNDAGLVEGQMIQGMVKVYPQYLGRLGCGSVTARVHEKEGRITLISGGGDGHEPAHGRFVGTGMLDKAVTGAVFTSSTPDQIYEGTETIATDAGVLMVVKSYIGDVVSFEMVAETAKMEGIMVKHVVTNDGVTIEDSLYTIGCRGVAGAIFVYKIVGTPIEVDGTLGRVRAAAQKVIDNVRTMGAVADPCAVSAVDKPGFELAENEMEMGIGTHGKPGTHREAMRMADEIVDLLLAQILTDLDYTGSEVAVMINGAGAAPLMELFIINNRVADVLTEKGVKVYKTMVGEYVISIGMQGLSISSLCLDSELEELLDAPADMPAWR